MKRKEKERLGCIVLGERLQASFKGGKGCAACRREGENE